jgi:hypothetical protein
MKKTLIVICAVILALVFNSYLHMHVEAAPDVASAGNAWQLIDVSTSAVTKVSLSGHDIMFAHTNLLSDGITTSTAGDYIVIMNASDVMAANLTAGQKLVIFAGGSASFRGLDASYIAADAVIEVQLKAVGHSAKVQMVKGSLYGSLR